MMPATGMNWFGSKLHPPSSFSGTPRTRKLLRYVLLPKQEEHNEPGTKDQHAGPARPGGRRLGLFPSPLVPDFFGDGLLGNVLLMSFPVLYDPRGACGRASCVQPDHADQEKRERHKDHTRPDGVETRGGSRTQIRYGDRQPGKVREHQENAARYRRRPNPPHKDRNLHPPLLSPGNLHTSNVTTPRYEPVTRSVTKALLRRIPCQHASAYAFSTLPSVAFSTLKPSAFARQHASALRAYAFS